ncbi:MAG: lysophospholipid acyltransferase family protein [Candidatus Omnitrophota bacterium]
MFNFKVYASENIPKKGSFIFVSNHASFLDPIILSVTCPKIASFMAKKELFANKLFGWYLGQLGCFSVNRETLDLAAVKEALRRIGQGKILIMFPQGGRRQGLDPAEAKGGVGFLAKKAAIPIVPAFIKGADQAWPATSRFFRPHPISVYIGRPISPFGALDRDQLTAKVIEEIKNLEKENSG